MGISDARDFLASKAFDTWVKNRELEQKVQLALIGRLDGVIKAIGGLGICRAPAVSRYRLAQHLESVASPC